MKSYEKMKWSPIIILHIPIVIINDKKQTLVLTVLTSKFCFINVQVIKDEWATEHLLGENLDSMLGETPRFAVESSLDHFEWI